MFVDSRFVYPGKRGGVAGPQGAPKEVARVLRLVEEAFDRKRRAA